MWFSFVPRFSAEALYVPGLEIDGWTDALEVHRDADVSMCPSRRALVPGRSAAHLYGGLALRHWNRGQLHGRVNGAATIVAGTAPL
jgi:hypothetical protein